VELSERDIAIIEFERTYWQLVGSKEAAIRQRFGLSTSRYYQLRDTLLDSREALQYDPLVIRRLLRLRNKRRAVRYGVPSIQPPIR